MYNNPYVNQYSSNFGQQGLNDRIDNQIAQLNQMKEQIRNNQQPAINQTFQLAPNNHIMRYADTIDDVIKETIYGDTPFFSKDMSVLWIKNIKGDIKTYELNEIIPKDSKDFEIEYLKSQIEELKGMINNDANASNVNAKQNSTNTSKYDKSTRNSIKDEKSTSISKISRSEKEQ